jgi:hypothetical protein
VHETGVAYRPVADVQVSQRTVRAEPVEAFVPQAKGFDKLSPNG